MKKFLRRLIHEEQGQDLVEYALIVAAVGLALITTVNQLSTATHRSGNGAGRAAGSQSPVLTANFVTVCG